MNTPRDFPVRVKIDMSQVKDALARAAEASKRLGYELDPQRQMARRWYAQSRKS